MLSESLSVLEPPCVTVGVAGLGDSDTVVLGLTVRVIDGDEDADGEPKLTLRTEVPVRVCEVDTVRDEDCEAVCVLEASTDPVRFETEDVSVALRVALPDTVATVLATLRVSEVLLVRLLENVTAVFAKLAVSD